MENPKKQSSKKTGNSWVDDDRLIDAWAEQDRNYGDDYRKYLINPVVYALLSEENWKEGSLYDAFMNCLDGVIVDTDTSAESAEGGESPRFPISPDLRILINVIKSGRPQSPPDPASIEAVRRAIEEGLGRKIECPPDVADLIGRVISGFDGASRPPPSLGIDTEWYKQELEGDYVNEVLELGCGGGYIGRWLSDLRVNYVGVDMARELLAKCNNDIGFGVDTDYGPFRSPSAQNPTFFVRDLDQFQGSHQVGTLQGIYDWKTVNYPQLILVISLLEHLERPDKLLKEIAALPSSGREENMVLVVTCNPAFYKLKKAQKTQLANNERVEVQISVGQMEQNLSVYLRSAGTLCKLFRDADFRVIDEAELPIPARLIHKFNNVDKKRYDTSRSPFLFWLLKRPYTCYKKSSSEENANSSSIEVYRDIMQGSVTSTQINAWINELQTEAKRPGVRQCSLKATLRLLESLEKYCDQLRWRRFRKGDGVYFKHNLGGRIFVVRTGFFKTCSDLLTGKSYASGIDSPGDWTFRSSSMFGELEAEDAVWPKKRYYFVNVRAEFGGGSDDVSNEYFAGNISYEEEAATVLEIPSRVVNDPNDSENGLNSERLFGHPFFCDSREKTLEDLVVYNPNLSDLSSAEDIDRWVNENCRAIISSNDKISVAQTPDDNKKPSHKSSALLAVATLVLRGLEKERRYSFEGSPSRLPVLIGDKKIALSHLTGLTPKLCQSYMFSYNYFMRLLVVAGILRVGVATKSQHSIITNLERLEHELGEEGKLGRAINEYSDKLSDREREEKVGSLEKALDELMSPSAWLVVVDDELALRKLVMDSSDRLIENLTRRAKYFWPRPVPDPDSDSDLTSVIVEGMIHRIKHDLWMRDSLGHSLVVGEPPGRAA